MTFIDRTYLSGNYPEDAESGMVARFYANGHLEFLGYFEYGECIRSLELGGSGAEGCGTNYKGSGGNVEWVNFDAAETQETFEAWVKAWIKWIEELNRYQGGHGDLPY